jgi:(p)ppGpp synthase/HD superfamily hydrolase
MIGFSDRYESALVLAARAHAGQFRKGTDIPYIVHPVHVAYILERHGFSEDDVISGLLHDVVEDSSVSLDLIREEFGDMVMCTVDAVTERKRNTQGEISWEERRADSLERLRNGPASAAAVRAADTLHNALTLHSEFSKYGAQIWNRFSRGPSSILSNYHAILLVVAEKLNSHPIVDELAVAVRGLELAIAGDGEDSNRRTS